MACTITNLDRDCLARGIVGLAPQIRAWLDTPEQQAKYQAWLKDYKKRYPPVATEGETTDDRPASP